MTRRTTRLIGGLGLAALLAAGFCGTAAARSRHAGVNIDMDDVQRGDVHVAKGETREGDIVTSGSIDVQGVLRGDCVSLGGAVTVGGEADGDVVSMGGPIAVSGKVKGDLTALGGDVTLDDGASVSGNVAIMSGRLKKAPGATIKGESTSLNFGAFNRAMPLLSRFGGRRHWRDLDLSERASTSGKLIGYGAFLAFVAGMGLMIVLLTAFLPKNVRNVSEAVKRDFWKSAGIGLLILMATGPALLLMTISIVGIPLVPLAIFLYCACVLMGTGAFGRLLSERLCIAMERPEPPILASVALGYLLLVSLLVVGKLIALTGGLGAIFGGIFAFAGLMLVCCALLVGLGAIWTTRMGRSES